MNSNKVTAIATSVIAICLVGFAFSGIYNDPKNVKERCIAKSAKKYSKNSLIKMSTSGASNLATKLELIMEDS